VSESFDPATIPYQQQPQSSSVTDLDETIKSTPLQQLHVAREIVERYDEGVFDDGAGSQTEEDENNSVVIADSDDEDEIEHFDATDVENNNQQRLNDDYLTDNKDNQTGSNNIPLEAQTVNLGNNHL
jgi:hypothetical protein